jgi:hypothetical protein
VTIVVPAVDAVVARKTVEDLLARPYPGEFEIVLAAPRPADQEMPPGQGGTGEQDGASEPDDAGDPGDSGGQSGVGAPADGSGPAVAADPLEDIVALDPRISLIHIKDTSEGALVNAAAFAGRYPVLSRPWPGSGDWVELLKHATSAMSITGADVVGGAAFAVGYGSAERAISRAMNSRLGVGPRPTRVGAAKGPVDSVRMVAIRRDAFERAGGLDQSFAGAGDWELQHRVRRSGGMVWLDPSLSLRRRAPASIKDLVRVFFHTGAMRRRIIAAHTDSSTWRYVVPPVLVGALVLTLTGGLIGGAFGLKWMWLLTLTPLVYALAVLIAVMIAGSGLGVAGRVRMWWSVMAIHLSWGAGFLFGDRRRGRNDPSRTAR